MKVVKLEWVDQEILSLGHNQKVLRKNFPRHINGEIRLLVFLLLSLQLQTLFMDLQDLSNLMCVFTVDCPSTEQVFFIFTTLQRQKFNYRKQRDMRVILIYNKVSIFFFFSEDGVDFSVANMTPIIAFAFYFPRRYEAIISSLNLV